MQRCCRLSGNGAMTGATSAWSRRTNLRANDLASEKLRRPEIEHLGNFFSDTAECLRILFDFCRLDDFLFDR
jgi:hypothetical protein